jgi:zinc protease
LRRMRDTEMTLEELKSAKDSIAQSLPARFEHAAETVGAFSEIYVYNLPLDYFSLLPAQIYAVTPELAQEAAKKYIQPDKMTVLAVGDRAKIEPGLKKLNLGKTQIRDPEGKLVQ